MRRFAVVLWAAVAACGPSNSPVTLGGTTLKPQSSLMYSIVFGPISATLVYVTDQHDICGTLSSENPCNLNSSAFGTSGSALEVIASGTTPGAYPIAQPDGGTTGFSFQSNIQFISYGGLVPFLDTAVSGTVWLDSVSINNSASGHYDVVMKSGSEIKGNFAGNYCAGLANAFSTGGTSCASTFNNNSCSAQCTCQSKTVKADCNQDAGTWFCTCTDSAGGTSTCSSTTNVLACDRGSSCCPLSF